MADRFVLNNLDSGYLRCFSRFFTFTDDPSVLAACRQAYAGALDQAHDFYDTFGFNTARRPRICRGRIWLDTACASAEGDLTLRDLQLVWPEEQPLPTLRHRLTLAPVQLRHTALCLSMLYPRLLENLLHISMPEDACYFAFRFGLFKQVEELAENSVVQFPRVLYGDLVLSRRQWWVPKALLPQRKATDSGPTYFRRVDEWRRGLGLPQRVFVRRHQLDKVLERDISNLKKPLFVDFSAPIMTRMIGRTLNTSFDYLSAEEMLPDHEHSFVSDGVSPYASEIIIEQACES